MGVIVSSSIGRSGSSFTGDTAHLVVVRTGSDWHDGTGTIVASLPDC